MTLTNISAGLVAGFPLSPREEVAVILYLSDRWHGVEIRQDRQPLIDRDIARVQVIVRAENVIKRLLDMQRPRAAQHRHIGFLRTAR
jgi:hypothetical protein